MKFQKRIISSDSVEFTEIHEEKAKNELLIQQLNSGIQNKREIIKQLSAITKSNLDESIDISLPFQTDYGKNIRFGKNIFVNKNAMFVDLGGIEINDNVMIGPNVTIVSVNHSKDPNKRRDLELMPVIVKENAWVGANAIIMPGVTIGTNSIVGAGALVTHDVPDNTTVIGVPARPL